MTRKIATSTHDRPRRRDLTQPDSAPVQPGDLAGKQFWDKVWAPRRGPSQAEPPPGHPIIEQILPARSDWTCLEIGCVPGKILAWMNRRFGYRVEGVDYSDRIDAAQATLQVACPGQYRLHHADFFQFSPARRYQVVCSFGFVEHFTQWQTAVRRHAELTEPGGYVVIEVPNFTHLQYFLRLLFEPQALRHHQPSATNPHAIASCLKRSGMDIIHAGHWRTFDLHLSGTGRLWRYYTARAVNIAVDRLRHLMVAAGLDNCPTRLLSPTAMVVARNRASRSRD